MRHLHAILTAAFAALLLSLTASPAQAHDGRGAHVEPYFVAGFGGQYRIRAGGEVLGPNDLGLDPTLGGGLRIDYGAGLIRYGLLGELRAYDDGRSGRDLGLDLAPFLGLRFRLVGDDDSALYLRGSVPIGFTVLWADGPGTRERRYRGWTTGLLGGLEMQFENFGIFGEVGVRHHRVYANGRDASVGWTQLAANAGISIYL